MEGGGGGGGPNKKERKGGSLKKVRHKKKTLKSKVCKLLKLRVLSTSRRRNLLLLAPVNKYLGEKKL